MTELRRIDALARERHSGDSARRLASGWGHFVFAKDNTPWCEMFLPPPGGGPAEAYRQFEAEQGIWRGPERIYMQVADRPGFGFELRDDQAGLVSV